MSLQIQSAVQLTIFVARRSLVTSGKFPEKHEHPQHRKTKIPRYKFKSNQNLNFNLHREMSRNLCFDLVDFGGVAIPVENVIRVLCVNVYVYTCVNLYLCVYADYVRVKTACVCESKCAYLA